MPTSFASIPCGAAAPIENSPPGIQTIPSGAGPGGVTAFATVGMNVDVVAGGDGAASGVAAGAGDLPRTTAIAVTPATAATTPNTASQLGRRGDDGSVDERDDRFLRALLTVRLR